MERKLGIYIHIPFCASKCGYCDFYSLAGCDKLMPRYHNALLQHIREASPQLMERYTDSVYLAVNSLLPSKPDIVVSGINNGANLCDDVIYSGTVAAAVEGRNLGLPAIAVSLCGSVHYDTAAAVVCRIIERIDECPIPSDRILNINVPDLPMSAIRGVRVTRLGRRMSSESVIEEKDLRGHPIYWIGPQAEALDKAEDTDIYAVSEGYVSVTPLHIDLTAYQVLDDLSGWISKVY